MSNFFVFAWATQKFVETFSVAGCPSHNQPSPIFKWGNNKIINKDKNDNIPILRNIEQLYVQNLQIFALFCCIKFFFLFSKNYF